MFMYVGEGVGRRWQFMGVQNGICCVKPDSKIDKADFCSLQNGVCHVEPDGEIVKADFCSFCYIFDQNTLLKTS